MALPEHHVYMIKDKNGHRDQLKKLLRGAYPSASKQKLKELEEENMARICPNYKTKKRRIVDERKWNEMKLDLKNKAMKAKSNVFSNFWSKQKHKLIQQAPLIRPTSPLIRPTSPPITPSRRAKPEPGKYHHSHPPKIMPFTIWPDLLSINSQH